MYPPRIQALLDPGSPSSRLASLFRQAGHRIFLVGGSVRDFLLGRDHDDLDFATSARPDEIRRIAGQWADDLYEAGALFGTIGVIKDSRLFEVTTFRSEVYRRETRKPEVRFADDVETDLSRRDFTVNALAIELGESEPAMIDPWGGLDDLAAGVLRTPLSPEVSFGEDPLRMLRLFRFIATLGFLADPEALAAVSRMADRLEIVSAERIADELSKLLVAPAPGEALAAMVDAGLADHFLPELSALADAHDPYHRHKDVLAHTLAVVDKCEPELVVRLAALLHDVGKPATRQFEGGGVSFHHHEVVGARMTKSRLQALRFPKSVITDVSRLVYLHMRPHTFKMGWTDRAVRRYVRDAGPLLEQLNQLVRSDVTTQNEKRERAIQRDIGQLEERIEELRGQEELDRLRPPIDGNQVMAHLGWTPGPRVGEVMRRLLDHRIDYGPYPEEEAYRLIDQWVREGVV
jgi:poly(A) polymerase